MKHILHHQFDSPYFVGGFQLIQEHERFNKQNYSEADKQFREESSNIK